MKEWSGRANYLSYLSARVAIVTWPLPK